MNIQGCVERLRVYHDRLLTQEVVVIPQTPAILIFLGNQTAQYLTVIRETLHLNISERHWKAVTVGCVTQDSLPIETESLRITVQDKERSFGEYAQEWRAVEGALQQMEEFCRRLMQASAGDKYARIMDVKDIFIFIDGNSALCELWSDIYRFFKNAGKIHLIWFYRTLNPAPRDAGFCKLFYDIHPYFGTEQPVESFLMERGYSDALGELENLAGISSLCVMSDHDGAAINSDDVFCRAVRSIAGYILLHMFNSQVKSKSLLGCSCLFLTYPDGEFGAAILRSALKKLEEYLYTTGSNALKILQDLLSSNNQWNKLRQWDVITLFSLMDEIIPETEDLFTIPINIPSPKAGEIRNQIDAKRRDRLLYGERGNLFFKRIEDKDYVTGLAGELKASLYECLEQFVVRYGAATAMILKNELAERLEALRISILNSPLPPAPNMRFTALDSLEKIRAEHIQAYGRWRIDKARHTGALHLLDYLSDYIDGYFAGLTAEKEAQEKAFQMIRANLDIEINPRNSSNHFYQMILKHAREGDLFVVEKSMDPTPFCEIAGRFAQREEHINLLVMLDCLTKICEDGNKVLYSMLDELPIKVGYQRLYTDYESVLRENCVPPNKTISPDEEEVFWVLPEGVAKHLGYKSAWPCRGDRMILIKLYTARNPNQASLFQNVAYLRDLIAQYDRKIFDKALELVPFEDDETPPLLEEKVQESMVISEGKDPREPVPWRIEAAGHNALAIAFGWPQKNVDKVWMHIKGTIRYKGEEIEINQTITRNEYIQKGNKVIVEKKLIGLVFVEIKWIELETSHSRSMELQGLREAVYYRLVLKRHHSATRLLYDLTVYCPNNKTLPVEEYLMLQKIAANGKTVYYELPARSEEGQYVLQNIIAPQHHKLCIQCKNKELEAYLNLSAN